MVFLLIAAFCFAIPAQAALKDMSATVYKWEGGIGADGKLVVSQITTGITFKVLARNSDTAETLYYKGKTTSLTNPIIKWVFSSTTVCNKQVAFRVDPTDSVSDRYVDLIVTDTRGGFTSFVKDFDEYTHTIVIDERFNSEHQGTIWFSGTTTTVTATEVYFLGDTFFRDIRVEVVSVSASQTLDVGLAEVDLDGFRKGVLLTTAGYIADTGVITDNTTNAYYPASTYGALIVTALTGTQYTEQSGGNSYKGYVLTSSQTSGCLLSYTNSGATASGYIHYFFTRMRR